MAERACHVQPERDTYVVAGEEPDGPGATCKWERWNLHGCKWHAWLEWRLCTDARGMVRTRLYIWQRRFRALRAGNMHHFCLISYISIGLPYLFLSHFCLFMLFSCISIDNGILRLKLYHMLNKHTLQMRIILRRTYRGRRWTVTRQCTSNWRAYQLIRYSSSSSSSLSSCS
jgi:hypothetical protein